PAHLRVDLKFCESGWKDELRRALRAADGLQCPLELVLHVTERPLDNLRNMVEALTDFGSRPFEVLVRARAIKRIIVFTSGRKTTAATESFKVAREFLREMFTPGHDLSLGGGTDADFYQLNQLRPSTDEMDFVAWSMNPQVHAFDLASLAETPTAIPAQIESAKKLFRGTPLVISPVTLKPRFNAVATGPERPVPSGELPPQVDVRQLTPFAAAWTMAVIKHLAETGAASVTLFETTGWQGVMERETGSPLPDKFPSQAGQVFPLFHVLGEINCFSGGEVLMTRSSDPLRVESLALTKNGWACVWLANLTGEPQTARLTGFERAAHQAELDWLPSQEWMFVPQTGLPEKVPARVSGVKREIELQLKPFGLVRLELEP
ncbi:MAG: hypothetical protein L0Z50_43410, partial [Verrucomicrobiales bacterium]|nr:hypothetical protein [Verrucomicrobiales bacterium]